MRRLFPNIASENLAQFKQLAAEALEITKGESGISQYDWNFNHDETRCVVRETYESSAAVLTHMENADLDPSWRISVVHHPTSYSYEFLPVAAEGLTRR